MDTNNLKTLIETLEKAIETEKGITFNGLEIGFNMGVFCGRGQLDHVDSCGTVGCLAGWARTLRVAAGDIAFALGPEGHNVEAYRFLALADDDDLKQYLDIPADAAKALAYAQNYAFGLYEVFARGNRTPYAALSDLGADHALAVLQNMLWHWEKTGEVVVMWERKPMAVAIEKHTAKALRAYQAKLSEGEAVAALAVFAPYEIG